MTKRERMSLHRRKFRHVRSLERETEMRIKAYQELAYYKAALEGNALIPAALAAILGVWPGHRATRRITREVLQVCRKACVAVEEDLTSRGLPYVVYVEVPR